jgi:hypothetical protein
VGGAHVVDGEDGRHAGKMLAAALVPELERDGVELAPRDVGVLGHADADVQDAPVRQRHFLLDRLSAQGHLGAFCRSRTGAKPRTSTILTPALAPNGL